MAAINAGTVSTVDLLSDKGSAKGIKTPLSNDSTGEVTELEIGEGSFHCLFSAFTEDCSEENVTGSDLPVAMEAAKAEPGVIEDPELQDSALLVMNIDAEAKKLTKEMPLAPEIGTMMTSSVKGAAIITKAMLSNQKPEAIKEIVTLINEPMSEALEAGIEELPMADGDMLFAERMKMPLHDRSLSLSSLPAPAISIDLTAGSQHRTIVSPLAPSTESTPSVNQQLTVTEEFASDKWGQDLGKQVLWLSKQNVNSAELRLNPANLGPIEVRIDVEDEQINVTFNSRNAAVREAVEQAMPRLREMFEQSGLNLADANVSQHSFAEQREQGAMREMGSAGQKLMSDDPGSIAEEQGRVTRPGSVLSMVDYYV